MKRAALFFLALNAAAAQLPTGTELSVRLTDPVASETTAAQSPVHAVLIAPIVVNGAIVVPAGPRLLGTVKQVKAADGAERAQLELAFTQISLDSYSTGLAAVVAGLDNAREAVGSDGLITGIDGSQTFASQLNQGIAKLQGNDRLAGLAGLISGAKQILRIQDANPNIDFDPGVELTLKLTQPLDWRGPGTGAEAKLRPVANQAALVELVNRQPFRTVAENPPRPSDMTNIMLIGTEQEIRAAFQLAGWSSAAQLSAASKLETARALIESRGYKEGPMSILLLDGMAPLMAYQKGNNTFAQRHHLRVFRRPETFQGKPVWVCSSTHDTGIDFSERDHTFIHKVDSEIDKERAKVVSDLMFTGLVQSLALVGRPAVPTSVTNATGDTMQTDGAMAVVLF